MLKTGTIKYYDPKKGFGFIRESVTNKEFFVHKKGIKYAAKELDVVTFSTKQTPSGIKAVEVRLAQQSAG